MIRFILLAFATAVLTLAQVSFASAATACKSTLPSPFVLRSTGSIPGNILSLIFDPDCKYVYARNDRSRIDIFSIEKGAWETPLPLSGPMDISPDGRFLYVVDYNNTLYAYNMATRAIAWQVALPRGVNNTLDLAVDNTGAVMVIEAGFGDSTPKQLWQVNADGSTTVKLTGDFIRFSVSRDRSLMFLWGGNGATFWRSTSGVGGFRDTGLTTPIGFSLNGSGSVGVSGDVVYNPRGSMPAKIGQIMGAGTSWYTRDSALNAAGTVAFQLRANTAAGYGDPKAALVEATDLRSLTRVGAFPVGEGLVANGVSRIAISADDSLVAVATATGISLIHVDTAGVGSIRFAVNSTRASPLYSFLRLHNTGAAAGAATVDFFDPDTGAPLGSWQSPPVAPGAAPQFDIGGAAASVATGPTPLRYIARITAAFLGTAAHVTWSPGGAIVNLSTCDTTVGIAPTAVANVHSSALGSEYPSEIGVLNTGTASAPVVLGIFDARDGTQLATYTGAALAAGAGRTFTVAELEQATRLVPSTAHYVIKLEGTLTGKLQHLVMHRATRVVSDMAMVCALPAPL